jgi:hypothetical protein
MTTVKLNIKTYNVLVKNRICLGGFNFIDFEPIKQLLFQCRGCLRVAVVQHDDDGGGFVTAMTHPHLLALFVIAILQNAVCDPFNGILNEMY